MTTIIFIIIDLILIFGANSISWWLRFKYNIFSISYPLLIPFKVYLQIIPLLCLIWIFFQSIFGSYRDIFRKKLSDSFIIIIKSSSISFVLTAAVSFILSNYFYSRLAMFYTWFLSIIFVCLSRLILRSFAYLFANNNLFVKNVVLVGDNEIMDPLEDKLLGNPFIRVAKKMENMDGKDILADIFSARSKDIFICYALTKWHKIRHIIEECVPAGINVKVVSEFMNIGVRKMSVAMVENIPMIEFSFGLLVYWNRQIKRIVDIIFAMLLTVSTFPFIVIISILIAIDSKGQVLFSQWRVGQGGKKFKILKFRTMYIGSEKKQKDISIHNNATFPIFKIIDDPRITRIGKSLRKFYIDEMPQLWNVLKGDMSIVGPRPLPVDEAEKLNQDQRKRYIVPPGITGLWQVTPSAKLSAEKMITLDMHYIENWNIIMDFYIICRTIQIIISKKGI